MRAILIAANKTEYLLIAGIVQLVEHLLAKEKVTGSSPVARSKDLVLGNKVFFFQYFARGQNLIQ